MSKYDLIVIGGGPAGYVGAIRAAQLGKKVACVEMDRAGGTCLNWGCIPTKSLLRNAELYQLMQHKADEFGFKFDKLDYDWDQIIGRSRKVSDRLAGGIEFLFKKNKRRLHPRPGQRPLSWQGRDRKVRWWQGDDRGRQNPHRHRLQNPRVPGFPDQWQDGDRQPTMR